MGGRAYFKISPVNFPFDFFLRPFNPYVQNAIKDLVFKLDALSHLLPNKNHGLVSRRNKTVTVRPSILLSRSACSGILSHDTLNNYWRHSGTCYLFILHCNVPLFSTANYAQELWWYVTMIWWYDDMNIVCTTLQVSRFNTDTHTFPSYYKVHRVDITLGNNSNSL